MNVDVRATIAHSDVTKAQGRAPARDPSRGLAELRRRIETGPGFGAVADGAGMSRMTRWRVPNGGGAQRSRLTRSSAHG